MYKILIINIVSMIILSSCNSDKSNSEESNVVEQQFLKLTSEQIKTGSIKMEKLNEVDFEGIVEVAGIVEVPPSQLSAVTTLMPGIIKKLNVLEGQFVQKGQILFYVESQEFISLQQEFATLNESLNYLKNDFERQTSLYNENANSEKKYLQAESEYKSNLANFKGLKKKIELLGIDPTQILAGNYYASIPIYAPISGSVKKIFGLNGSFISTSESVLEIVNINKANLVLQVFESQLESLKVNQTIEFSSSLGKVYHAKIKNIGASLDQDSKTVQVIAEIIDSVRIFDGMHVNAKIITHNQKIKGVSSIAVLNENSSSFIYVLDHTDKQTYFFEKKQVTINMKNDKWVSFTNATDFDDKFIITDGANMLNF